MSEPARIPAGFTTGGQFTTASRDEAPVQLVPTVGATWQDYQGASGPAERWQVLTRAAEQAVTDGTVATSDDEADALLAAMDYVDVFDQAEIHRRTREGVQHAGPREFGAVAFDATRQVTAESQERLWADAYHAAPAAGQGQPEDQDAESLAAQGDLARKQTREGGR